MSSNKTDISEIDRDNRKVIRQANALAGAAYSLNLTEKRLVYVALDSIARGKVKQDSYRNYPVKILHTDFAKLFNVSINNVSRDIQAATSSLNSKEVVFYLPDDDDGEDKAIDGISWTTKRSHRPKSGATIVYFNGELVDIITKADKNFTRLLQDDIAKLESPQSMRLYDTLKQWENKGQVVLHLNWLFERYEITEAYRNRMSDFRRRFLKPCVDEINSKTSLTVDYKELKGKERKNAVYAIQFFIESDAPVQQSQDIPKTIESAVDTYMKITQRSCLPSIEEIENLKNFMGALMLDNFEFTPEIIATIKEAESASREIAECV